MLESIESSAQNPDSTGANSEFVSLLPTLEGHCRRMASRLPRRMRQDAHDDLLAAMYLNHHQAAQRREKLGAAALAWAGQHYLHNRTWINLPPVGRRGVRPASITMDPFTDPDMARRIGVALSSNEKSSPLERTRVKLDWRALSRIVSRRDRQILWGLSIGRSKSEIAARLRISNGRLSQRLTEIRKAIIPYLTSGQLVEPA